MQISLIYIISLNIVSFSLTFVLFLPEMVFTDVKHKGLNTQLGMELKVITSFFFTPFLIL